MRYFFFFTVLQSSLSSILQLKFFFFGCVSKVRKKAKEIIVLDGMIDFAIPGLRLCKPNLNSRRAAILDSCKLPSIQKLGVTIGTSGTEEVSFIAASEHPLWRGK